jgi:hypothetical protein
MNDEIRKKIRALLYRHGIMTLTTLRPDERSPRDDLLAFHTSTVWLQFVPNAVTHTKKAMPAPQRMAPTVLATAFTGPKFTKLITRRCGSANAATIANSKPMLWPRSSSGSRFTPIAATVRYTISATAQRVDEKVRHTVWRGERFALSHLSAGRPQPARRPSMAIDLVERNCRSLYIRRLI